VSEQRLLGVKTMASLLFLSLFIHQLFYKINGNNASIGSSKHELLAPRTEGLVHVPQVQFLCFRNYDS
jgi:hypothetical protein